VITFAVAAPRDWQTSQSDVGSFDMAKPVSPQWTAALFLASLAWPCTGPAPIIHYVLNDNLEQVDVAPRRGPHQHGRVRTDGLAYHSNGATSTHQHAEHGWPSHDRLIAMHAAGTSSPKMTKAVTVA
jgi:hypothetical protein